MGCRGHGSGYGEAERETVMISLIVAVDAQGGIGKNNQLLCHLPADLAYFKSKTLGKPIIMGRKTFESIGRALPGRHNIIVSQTLISQTGVTCVDSFEAALKLTQHAPEIMVIGGAKLFEIAISYADRIYLTYIDHVFEADVFFPALSTTTWKCISQEKRMQDEKNAYALTFCIYERV